jgi:hypothetical protein
MPRGTPAVKLAITVEAGVHAKLLRAAEADGLSVSAWMTAAARHAPCGFETVLPLWPSGMVSTAL